MVCDDVAKDLLKQGEKSGSLNLDGNEDDKNRMELMEKIIINIAKDTPNEAIIRKVE